MKFGIEFTDDQVKYFEFLKYCEVRYADAEYAEDSQAMRVFFNEITRARTEYCKKFNTNMLTLLVDLDLYFMCKNKTERR